MKKRRSYTQEEKEKIRITAISKGYGKWMSGKKLTSKWKKAIGLGQKRRKEKFGYYFSPEAIEKIKKAVSKYTIKYCLFCNKKILVPPCLLKRKKFCSKSCSARYRKGQLAAHWKGGKGTERHTAMSQLEYKKWRKTIFERDDYTCQMCGARGVKLNADHIKKWSEYPEFRYDINNGRTLCVKCHHKIT